FHSPVVGCGHGQVHRPSPAAPSTGQGRDGSPRSVRPCPAMSSADPPPRPSILACTHPARGSLGRPRQIFSRPVNVGPAFTCKRIGTPKPSPEKPLNRFPLTGGFP